MSLDLRRIVFLSIFIVAVALVFNSKSREHMSTLFQFGKSLFSARHTSVNDAAGKPSFYEQKFMDIKGQPLDMDQFRGKVTLLVNTASECGYTPQLYTLQELQNKYQSRGFTVLVWKRCLVCLFLIVVVFC